MNEALLTEALVEEELTNVEKEDELTQQLVEELEREILDEEAATEQLLDEIATEDDPYDVWFQQQYGGYPSYGNGFGAGAPKWLGASGQGSHYGGGASFGGTGPGGGAGEGGERAYAHGEQLTNAEWNGYTQEGYRYYLIDEADYEDDALDHEEERKRAKEARSRGGRSSSRGGRSSSSRGGRSSSRGGRSSSRGGRSSSREGGDGDVAAGSRARRTTGTVVAGRRPVRGASKSPPEEQRTATKTGAAKRASASQGRLRAEGRNVYGESAIAAAFAHFDRNNSGYLDYKELRNALRHYGLDVDTEGAKAILAAYDDQPDGKLDPREFYELVKDIEDGTTRLGTEQKKASAGAKKPKAAGGGVAGEGTGRGGGAEASAAHVRAAGRRRV